LTKEAVLSKVNNNSAVLYAVYTCTMEVV